MTTIEGLADAFMLSIFEVRPIWTPSDLDELVGANPLEALADVIGHELPAFNRSVFGKSLARLVQSEEIEAEQDEDGGWMYRRAPRKLAAKEG